MTHVGEFIGDIPVIDLDNYLLFDQVEVFHAAKIAIEHILVVIVAHLHHAVANADVRPRRWTFGPLGFSVACDCRFKFSEPHTPLCIGVSTWTSRIGRTQISSARARCKAS